MAFPKMGHKELVSDNGAQFENENLTTWLAELNIQQIFTSVAHPQDNGQVEHINRSIVEGIKTHLGTKRTGWVDKVPHVLWAHRTLTKTSNDKTPFSLTYGSEAVIPAEMGCPSARVLMAAHTNNDQELRLNLDLLEERRERAAIREANYKKNLERYYIARVKHCEFCVGDYVFPNSEASNQEKPGKLAPTWKGPYKIGLMH